MQITRVGAIVGASLLLVFSIIHLGVSIAIVARYRHYGDVFRPERGLGAFNIIISIYALLLGGFGLFSVLTDRGLLSRTVALGCIALAFFGIISLITALIINSLAVRYVNDHFIDNINSYSSSQDSRNIIDQFQINYACCGDYSWLDWAGILNATANSSSGATTAAPAANSTASSETSAGTTTTPAGNATSTTTSGETAGSTTTPVSTNQSTSSSKSIIGIVTSVEMALNRSVRNEVNRDLRSITNNMKTDDQNLLSTDEIINELDLILPQSLLQQSIRRKRQAQASYGGIPGLPTSFVITLPQSCCSTDTSTTENLSTAYCASSVNNVPGNFHTNGCTVELGKHAVGLSLGIAVINSFLIAIALATIPLLTKRNIPKDSTQNGYSNESAPQYQEQDPYGGNNSQAPYNASNENYPEYY